jgi:hypothetical protein
MGEARSVVLLRSTSHAIRAERLVQEAGVACALIPVPRHLSSDCGVCLRLSRADKNRALAALRAGNIDMQGVHDLDNS